MTLVQRTHARIAPMALLVAGLAAAGFLTAPEKAKAWIVCLAGMGAMWLLVAVVAATKSGRGEAQLRYLTWSANLAGAMLVVALGGKLAEAGGLADPDWIDRGQGVATGLILAVIGNFGPKMIVPLTEQRCSPSENQAVQRFSGWLFTLVGLAYAAVSVLAAEEAVTPICLTLVGSAVVLIAGRCALGMMKNRAGPKAS